MVPETPTREETECLFEALDLKDPFYCPVFNLGSLDDSQLNNNEDQESTIINNNNSQNITKNATLHSNIVSNVAVIATDSIEEIHSGQINEIPETRTGISSESSTNITTAAIDQLEERETPSINMGAQKAAGKTTRHPKTAQKI